MVRILFVVSAVLLAAWIVEALAVRRSVAACGFISVTRSSIPVCMWRETRPLPLSPES